MQMIKRIIRYPFNLMGLQIVYLKEYTESLQQDFYTILGSAIKDKNINFIDIGANKGQSIDKATVNFHNLKSIIAVEPVINDELISKINESKIKIELINKAIGCVGEISIRLNEHSGLNSIHEFNPSYDYLIGGKQNLGIINVQCISLNDVLKKISPTKEFVNILKIDTQGYEDKVLESGMILKTGIVDFLLIEVILIEKYKSQAKYLNVMNLLDDLGFVLIDAIPFFKELDGKFVKENKFGQFTEMDLLYVHRDSMERFNLKR